MVLLDVCVSTCQRVLGGSNMSRTIPDALPRILGVAWECRVPPPH